MMAGKLIGVSVGPGDPELMTFKAARMVRDADVVAYLSADGKPGLARAIASAHIRSGQHELAIDMPMRVARGDGQNVYDAAAIRIGEHLIAGQTVAFLCEGDAMFFGSFMYVLDRLRGDFAVEIVPGVASPMAAAAMARVPLCARDDVFCVLPATLPDEEIEQRLRLAPSIVIMKLGRHLPRIKALLARQGLIANAVYVERATMEDQVIRPLQDLDAETAPYFSLVLVANASVGANR